MGMVLIKWYCVYFELISGALTDSYVQCTDSGQLQIWSEPSEILNARSSSSPGTKLGETPKVGTYFIWLAKRNKGLNPSITDGVHRNENFEEIIPVFSTFSNFFKQNKKKNYKSHFM